MLVLTPQSEGIFPSEELTFLRTVRMRRLPHNLPTERVETLHRVELSLACSCRDHPILFPACRSVRAIARVSQPNRLPFPHSLHEAIASALPVYPFRNLVSPE